MNILLAGTRLVDFACASEECLSWIIILLNILTVFYLIFCIWFKVNEPVKIIGYVWASILAVSVVAVVAVHACLFTVFAAVFTALIEIALLSVVLDKGEKEEGGVGDLSSGAYVVHKTDRGNFAFVLYDDKKRAVARSRFKFATILEAKENIRVCRENGAVCAVEDRTKPWAEYADHPKFELLTRDGKFFFVMSLKSEAIVLCSEEFDSREECEKTLNAAMTAVLSEKVFFAEREILSDRNFIASVESETVVTVVKKARVAVFEEIELDENGEAKGEAKGETEGEEKGVKFSAERKTLREAYADLSEKQKEYFDKIRARAEEKEKVRSSESRNALTVSVGRDKIVKLRIRKDTVESVFFVTDGAFRRLNESAAKIKDTPTVIKIIDDEYLKLALDTIDYRYEAVVAERKAKRKNER